MGNTAFTGIQKTPEPGKEKHHRFHFTVKSVQAILSLSLAILCSVYTWGLRDTTACMVASARRELPIYSVEKDTPVIAISFDASWGGDKTMQLLEILDTYQIKTTFFLVNLWVEKYPELVQEIFARGHEIGNHSTTHPKMSTLSENRIIEELRVMSDDVEKLTGTRPTLFRPPYGDYNNRVITTARAQGYEAVQWSVDSLDWKNLGTKDIVRRATKVQNGDIVLFHNDSNDILNALPQILDYYKENGYQVVPVSELILQGDTTIDVQGKQHQVKSQPSAKEG